MENFGAVFYASFRAVLSLFLLTLPGFLMSQLPTEATILDESALKTLSNLCVLLFFPCLIFSSIASSISVEVLSAWWPFIAWCLITLSISFTFSFSFFKLTERFWRKFVDPIALQVVPFVCCFQNSLTYFLPVFDSLCDMFAGTPGISEQLFRWDSAEACKSEVTSFVFVYSFSFTLIFWSCGYSGLTAISVRAREEREGRSISSSKAVGELRPAVREGGGATSEKSGRERQSEEGGICLQQGEGNPGVKRDKDDAEERERQLGCLPSEMDAVDFPPLPLASSLSRATSSRRDRAFSSDRQGDGDGQNQKKEKDSPERQVLAEKQTTKKRAAAPQKPGGGGMTFRLICFQGLLAPNSIAIYMAVSLGLWPAFRHALFEDQAGLLFTLGRVTQTLGSASVPAVCTMLGAALGRSLHHNRLRRRAERERRAEKGQERQMSPKKGNKTSPTIRVTTHGDRGGSIRRKKRRENGKKRECNCTSALSLSLSTHPPISSFILPVGPLSVGSADAQSPSPSPLPYFVEPVRATSPTQQIAETSEGGPSKVHSQSLETHLAVSDGSTDLRGPERPRLASDENLMSRPGQTNTDNHRRRGGGEISRRESAAAGSPKNFAEQQETVLQTRQSRLSLSLSTAPAAPADREREGGGQGLLLLPLSQIEEGRQLGDGGDSVSPHCVKNLQEGGRSESVPLFMHCPSCGGEKTVGSLCAQKQSSPCGLDPAKGSAEREACRGLGPSSRPSPYARRESATSVSVADSRPGDGSGGNDQEGPVQGSAKGGGGNVEIPLDCETGEGGERTAALRCEGAEGEGVPTKGPKEQKPPEGRRHGEGVVSVLVVTAAVVCIKLVVVPLIGAGLLTLVMRLSALSGGDGGAFLPPDPWVRLVIWLEFAAPPAMNVLVSMNKLDMHRESQFLSMVYLPVYGISLLSSSVSCSWALMTFFDY
uniref:Uncharacterized protein n=1 Tax=Chromera velia CCMP2878 TaxID=1169474 RepID=A0A0G4HLV5_9ALVE|eukprot:Cvel_28909.t1-p1 / transcript=Cvel_28909.t1 / gene=Cvel_28909 / organism=Chromera_velia_CCMP2878 / gene_product=hypothetical protein / transcript_product=hypothetical protein / location=Cvel_scaffold3867:3853-9140(-) / protein_length=936 / sequence_SO=supercontig / SO=protein_coding / is_pseudo=false